MNHPPDPSSNKKPDILNVRGEVSQAFIIQELMELVNLQELRRSVTAILTYLDNREENILSEARNRIDQQHGEQLEQKESRP
jgi:hypothetical protein